MGILNWLFKIKWPESYEEFDCFFWKREIYLKEELARRQSFKIYGRKSPKNYVIVPFLPTTHSKLVDWNYHSSFPISWDYDNMKWVKTSDDEWEYIPKRDDVKLVRYDGLKHWSLYIFTHRADDGKFVYGGVYRFPYKLTPTQIMFQAEKIINHITNQTKEEKKMPMYRVTEKIYRDLEVRQFGVQVFDVEADDEDSAKRMSSDDGELISETWEPVAQEDMEEAIKNADGYSDYEENISVVQIDGSSADHMFIKVVYKGKVDQVMISRGGVIEEALDAANVSLRDVINLTVTGVRCCADTQLRPDDAVYVD